MKPGSLRVRLLAGAAVWVAAALILNGIALLYLFEANIERGVREDLTAIRNRLIAVLSTSPAEAAIEAELTDPRYATPFGGLYWQAENLDSGETLRSRSLWDTTLHFPPALLRADPGFATLDGPDNQRLSALGSAVTVEGTGNPATYLIVVAQDRSAIDRSTRQFSYEMTLASLILGLALFLAAWIQVHLGLSPLRKLAAGVEAIRTGRTERLGTDYPSEVLPLVSEVNELLAARDKSLDAARTRAGDLAHGLKTPIAVLSATADRLRHRGDGENADALETLSQEMTEQVDYQLRLAGIRPRTSTTVIRSSLNSALLRTISVLRKTRQGEAIHWEAALGADVDVDVDGHDLLELVGIVLENATKWAQSSVSVSTAIDGNVTVTVVSDDGPGLSDDEIARIGVRGLRFNHETPGSGFGLAIAREIATTNRGTIDFARAKPSGLSVTIRLPAAQ